MRIMCAVATIGVLACSAPKGGGGGGGGGGGTPDAGPPPLNPPAWQITVDMSSLDRFVTGAPPTWPIHGVATASLGLAGVDVSLAPATVDQAGAFDATATPAPGLTVVPIVAHDLQGHARQAHRTLIDASYVPEGPLTHDAAKLALTDAILSAMAGSVTAGADLDIAAKIMAMPTLSVDSRCTTWPTSATQDPTVVTLQLVDAQLQLSIHVPNLYVSFDGACDGLFSTIPIAGEMSMNVDAVSTLSPSPAVDCLHGFDHTTPAVDLPGFAFDVWGTGGPLTGWLVELASSGKAQQAHDQFQAEFQAEADATLTEKLADVVVFDHMEQMTLLGTPIDVRLCASDLVSEGGLLVAHISSSSSSMGAGGDRMAPGAPQLGGPSVTPGPNELVLDADFVGRLLFSAWRKNALTRMNVQQVDFSLLSLIARDLVGRHPDDAKVDISIDGELPPVVSASPMAGADLRIDIGDLMLTLAVGDDRLFRFGARVTLDLDLVPDSGSLVPTLVAVSSEVHLLDEVVDGDDAALEAAVQSKLGDSAAGLLAGAKLTLPTIPGLGAPMDVTADPGGRYVHIHMQ